MSALECVFLCADSGPVKKNRVAPTNKEAAANIQMDLFLNIIPPIIRLMK
jgi:hypothetical protein